MAEFKFNCPQCKTPVTADESLRGTVVMCPHCEKGIVVPRNEPKSGLKPPKARPKVSVPSKSPVAAQIVQVKCPHCGTVYEVDCSEYGKQAKCEICGKPIKIGSIPQSKRSFLKTYFSTKGRSARSEWWKLWAMIDLPIIALSVLMFIVTVVRCVSMADSSNIEGIASTIMACWICIILLVLASCILMTPVTVRRLHDRNMSGWWLLVFGLLPFGIWAEILIVRCLAGTLGENNYGSAFSGDCGRWRQTKKGALGVVLAIIFVAIVIFIFALPSTTQNQEDVTDRLVDRQAQTSSVVQSEELVPQVVESETKKINCDQVQTPISVHQKESVAQSGTRKEGVQSFKKKIEKIRGIKKRINGILSGEVYKGFGKENIWKLSPTVSLRDENSEAMIVSGEITMASSNGRVSEANNIADKEVSRVEGRLSELEKMYSEMKEALEKRCAAEEVKELEARKEKCAKCDATGIVQCANCKGASKIPIRGKRTCPKCSGEGESPQSVECRRCSGKGYIRTRCASCGGRGKLRQDDRTRVDYGMYTIRCGSCRGSGKGPRECCTNCSGNGKINKNAKCANCQGSGNIVVFLGKEDCWCCDGKCRIKCASCDGKGFMYRPRNEEEIARLKQNAEQGHASSQCNLGECYANGEGVEKNVTEAVKWYRMAAEQGYAAAQYHLGECYANGEGVEQNHREAMKWFRKAAEQGHSKAQYKLGEFYAIGEGVKKDCEEAAKWFRKAAEQGDVNAQSDLGTYYANGEGVPTDDREAMKWFSKAAEQGSATAQYNLGLCYGKGKGVKEDRIAMVKWFRKAAEQGLAEAQYDLGRCYINGYGVKQDYSEAMRWFVKVANQGNVEAQYAVGGLYHFGLGVQMDDGEALKWYRRAAEQGHSKAQYELGISYGTGRGVRKDIGEAVKWLRKAAAQGQPDAQEFLRRDGIEDGYNANSNTEVQEVRNRYQQTLDYYGLTEVHYENNRTVCVLCLSRANFMSDDQIAYHKEADLLEWPSFMPKGLAKQLLQDRMLIEQYTKIVGK